MVRRRSIELRNVTESGFLLGLVMTAAAFFGSGYLYGKWRSSKQDSGSGVNKTEELIC